MKPPAILERGGGLPPLQILHDPDEPSITPASRLCLDTIDAHADLIRGRGIDWGTGTGLLAIAAATHPGVDLVVGLDIDPAEVERARVNARLNGVAHRTVFLRADLFEPFPSSDGSVLAALRGRARFLIANPPFDPEGDGLGWRRAVLREARHYLVDGAPVLLQVSRQYGTRIEALADDVGGFRYRSLLGTTDWVPFDQSRADLKLALEVYAAEEHRSGVPYPFRDPAGREIDASEALRMRDAEGVIPLSQWQMHLLVRTD